MDPVPGIKRYTSLALDRRDAPHISYTSGDSPSCLKYAKAANGAWSVEVVDSTGDVGGFSSLQLGENGSPRIAYADKTRRLLRYAQKNGDGWSIESVDTGYVIGVSLNLDSADNPLIAYANFPHPGVKYAFRTAGKWVIETLDSVGTIALNTTLAVDRHGNPTIAYRDLARGLKCARRTSTGWMVELVDPADLVDGISIAVDSQGDPHISYSLFDLGLNRGDLKYAQLMHDRWSITAVDTATWFTALALDPSGSPSIAYTRIRLEGTDTDLAFASAGPGRGTGKSPIISMAQPSPNPSRAGTVTFVVHAEQAGTVTLAAFDARGRRVSKSTALRVDVGTQTISWSLGIQVPGLYFLRMDSSTGEAAVQRLVIAP